MFCSVILSVSFLSLISKQVNALNCNQNYFHRVNSKFKSKSLSKIKLYSILDNAGIENKRSSSKTFSKSKFSFVTWLPVIGSISSFILPRPIMASSLAGDFSKFKFTPFQGATLWAFLFFVSASLHSAESAITKLSTWKIQEFVEAEGPSSPFADLAKNMTSLLSTILITTTACSIYSTALFVSTAVELFPSLNLGIITAILTLVTLFLGELLPKALAVSNSEFVARQTVPIIYKLSMIMFPITSSLTTLSNFLLKTFGMKSKEENNVSEDMLRLVVKEAERSEGIQTDESEMIKAVLDLQDTDVSRIIQPRINIIALPENTCAEMLLETALSTRYSRIPIYKDDIDHIIGVVFTKDLLVHLNRNVDDDVKDWKLINATQIMQPTYFIPETMKVLTAMQEMRKRRIHMAIVVDEYGGTSGLVTFEDILEEVVGEIYDEDDSDEQADDFETIAKSSDESYNLRGSAELDDVCDVLGLKISEEIVGEATTIGGLLCSLAGKIPKENEVIELSGFEFVILEVEDNRKILRLSVSKKNNTENFQSSQEN